jgi:hypothetical protein
MIGLLAPEDWKRAVALVILWAYAYQLCAWPLLFWMSLLVTAFTGHTVPAPPLMPWEHLATGTGTLGMIGGIQVAKDKFTPGAPA